MKSISWIWDKIWPAGYEKIKGAAGDSIRLRFAEFLQPDGELYMDNLRDARVTDTYICRGIEKETTWAPRFVYHGFRYVEVTGYPSPELTDFTGEVVSDEMEHLGTFSCSDSMLNRIYRNAYWGVLSNYKGMPVDCPQRNERQPWLGDRVMGVGEKAICSGMVRYMPNGQKIFVMPNVKTVVSLMWLPGLLELLFG